MNMDAELAEQLEGIDEIIRSETHRILGQWLTLGADLSFQDRQMMYDREALKLQQLTEDAAEQLRLARDQAWRQEHPGQMPPFEDALAWRETAWRQAREMTMAQLYERVTPEIAARRQQCAEEIQQLVHQRHEKARLARDPDRWKSFNVAEMPIAERVVHRVWLDQPAWFRSLAVALVTQRIQDGLPVPSTAYDPLADQLAAVIDQEIAANPPSDINLPF